jgi:hypothetical protein
MTGIAPRAELLRRQLDESLVLTLHDSCETAVAFARLDAALDHAIAAIDHPALTLEHGETRYGHRRVVRFLGRAVMRWCFHQEHVDVFCHDGSTTTQLRLRYAAHAREWRIWGTRDLPLWSFDDEEEKVLEFLEDALRATLPWVGPASVADEE